VFVLIHDHVSRDSPMYAVVLEVPGPPPWAPVQCLDFYEYLTHSLTHCCAWLADGCNAYEYVL